MWAGGELLGSVNGNPLNYPKVCSPVRSGGCIAWGNLPVTQSRHANIVSREDNTQNQHPSSSRVGVRHTGCDFSNDEALWRMVARPGHDDEVTLEHAYSGQCLVVSTI